MQSADGRVAALGLLGIVGDIEIGIVVEGLPVFQSALEGRVVVLERRHGHVG